MKLRAKLLLPMVLAALVFMLIVHGYVLPNYEKEEGEHLDKIHAATLNGASLLIAPYVETNDLKAISRILDDYIKLDHGLAAVSVMDLSGAVLYRIAAQNVSSFSHNLEGKVVSDGHHLANIEFVIDTGHYFDSESSHIYGIGYIFIVVFIFLFIATFLIQDAFVRRPIKTLLTSVNSIAYGDFDAAIPVSSSDEIGDLAASIKLMRNNMISFQKSLQEKTIKANDLADSLYDSKHRMQAIIDNITHGIVVSNESGVIESVNSSLCDMLGYTEGELIGENINLFIPDKYKEQHLHGVRRFLETGVSTILGKGVNELEVLSKSGSIIPVDLAITGMTLGGKRYFNAVISDVTERKLADIKLRKERDRAQRYLDTVEVMVVALDLDAKIILVNRKGLELVGSCEDDLLGKKWSEVCLRSQDQEQFESLFRNQLGDLGGFIDSSESIILSRDQRENMISWRYSQLLDENGRVAGLLCSGTDITAVRKADQERESMQQQLQQSQKMQAIGQLTGGIAHDFNNIIASILGHAELLMIRLSEYKDEKALKYLDNIYRSSERARDLVEKMLAFSRGRGKDLPAAIDVESAIHDIINILRSVLPATIGINVTSSGKGIGVLAAPIDLQQIVMNLCINARDAMAGNGELDISVKPIRDMHQLVCSSCHQNFEGDYVIVSVSDNGSGIAAEQMARLFEPFFTTKEVGKGTGMGLAVVHGIVHDLGGHILVNSTPGRGTCFQIYLKAASTTQNEQVSMRESCNIVHGAGKVVLIVDDEPLVREFLSELLSESGYGVLLAADPFEALDIVKSKHNEIDAIITDQSMPGMTGVQMARIISNMISKIPIVLSTGYGEGITEAELKDAGVQFMLNKPMKGQDMLSAIEKIIGGERPGLVIAAS